MTGVDSGETAGLGKYFCVAWRNADILVCGFRGLSSPRIRLVVSLYFMMPKRASGDWKVARTRRLEGLRYCIADISPVYGQMSGRFKR